MVKLLAFMLATFLSSCFVKSKTTCTDSESTDPVCARGKLSEAYAEERVSRVAIKIELLLTEEGSSKLLVDPQDLEVAAYVQSTSGFEAIEFHLESGEFLDRLPISTDDLKREIPVTLVIPKEISDRVQPDADGYFLFQFELSGKATSLLAWFQAPSAPLMKTLIVARPQAESTPTATALLSIASSIATEIALSIYEDAVLTSIAGKIESVRQALGNLQMQTEGLLQPLQSEKTVSEIIEIIRTFTIANMLIDKTTQESIASTLAPTTDLESSKVTLEEYVDSLAETLNDLAVETQEAFTNKKDQLVEATSVSTVEQTQAQTVSTESNTADLVFTPEAMNFEDTDTSTKIAGSISIEPPRVKTGLTEFIVYLGPQQLAKDAIINKTGLRELGRIDFSANQSSASLTIADVTPSESETHLWVFSVAGSSVINVPLVASYTNTVTNTPPAPDTTAPTVGTSIVFSSITSNSAIVSWGSASDAATSNAATLQYKLVVASTTGAIDSISEVEAISGGSLLMDWTAGTTSRALSSLVMNTAYYLAVLVRDAANNKALYSPQGFTTSCTCSAGYYSSAGNCVAAETGFYATSCNLSACTNKPNNSSYLGTAFSSNSCAWACDNGYVANSTFTGCTANTNYVPLSCGSNQLAVGLSGRSASWMDKLGLRCQNFANGALTGSIQTGTEFGGSGGTAFTKDCPNGSAIHEIEYANHVGNSQNVAGRIRFRCKNLSTGSVSSWLPQNGDTAAANNGGTYYYGEGSSISTGTMACASPYYVNWFTIESSGGYTGVFSGNVGCRTIASQTNIIAQWQFENSGVDSAPSGTYPLTANGGLTYSGATKKYGGYAAAFDGTNDYLSSGSSLLNGLSQFTVVGWVYLSSRVGTDQVSFWGQNDLIEMGLNNTAPHNDVCVWVNGSNEQCSSTELSLNTWYQIAITMSASNGTILYLNGTQVSNTSISTTGATSAFPFTIGGAVWDPSGDFLHGFVDDVLIYSRELSAAEIAQLYGN